MRLLETLVATPVAQAVGWTLLHSLWEGAIVAAGLAALLGAMRSSRARYAATCVAMLVMLGAIGLTFVHVMPEGAHGLRTLGTATFPAWSIPTDMDATGPSSPGLAGIVPWLAPFWIAGVWIFALGQLAGWISVYRLRRRGVCCAPERWQRELARLSALLRVSRPVLLLESCLADVPMVLGHFRPIVLMPVGLLAGLPAGQIEAILLHELAHIRRYDYLVNVLQRSAECLLFYHPAVWWISRVIRTERENCCDDVVVATRGNVQEYAVALASLEHYRCSGREPALAATGGTLLRRIHRLLYPKSANGSWTPIFAGAILTATAVVALAAWPPEPRQQGATAEKRQEETTVAAGTVQLKPFPAQPLQRFRITANSRKVFETLARLAGLGVTFTSDFQAQPIGVDLSDVTIKEALGAVCDETRSFWKPVASDTILIIPDNQDNRRKYMNRPEDSPYGRWLNEEVVYIIAAEERTAFKKLTTDEEREMFIKQFWERRNPNPGSPENKFKEEHYRRIAYANKHYATSRQGWRTDRGRMYIVYGPPDEINVAKYGTAPGPHIPYGIEVWTYRHVKGVGDNLSVQFMDTTGKGDYELPTGQPSSKPTPRPEEAQPRKGDNMLAPRAKGRAESSSYDRWVNEEVVYIITDQERAQFQKLTTDEERNQFIEQFWDRRNPNPGSPENEFREEYYGRIAYANEHWATDRPGWTTDRGHMYIIYGPPDEIDSHPSGPPYPIEEWRYRYIRELGFNVVFKFIDPKETGRYQLASPRWKSLGEKNSTSP